MISNSPHAAIQALSAVFYFSGLDRPALQSVVHIDDRTRFGLYRDSTAHRFSAYMGGFHNSPEHAWDEGYEALVSVGLLVWFWRRSLTAQAKGER